MSKPKRILKWMFALQVIAISVVLMRPSECDYSVDNQFEISVWLENQPAKIGLGSGQCDPWSRLVVEPIEAPIAFQFQINGYPGPFVSNFYIQPDGKAYVMTNDWSEDDLFAKPADVLANADAYENVNLFTDLIMYERVSALVNPSRHHTGPVEFDLKIPGTKKMTEVDCDVNGYHFAYIAFWSGDFSDDSEVSYFEGGLRDSCNVLDTIHARFRAAARMMELAALDANLPTNEFEDR